MNILETSILVFLLFKMKMSLLMKLLLERMEYTHLFLCCWLPYIEGVGFRSAFEDRCAKWLIDHKPPCVGIV